MAHIFGFTGYFINIPLKTLNLYVIFEQYARYINTTYSPVDHQKEFLGALQLKRKYSIFHMILLSLYIRIYYSHYQCEK